MRDATIYAGEKARGAKADGLFRRVQNVQHAVGMLKIFAAGSPVQRCKSQPSTTMHATSQKQQQAAGAALLAKRGQRSKSSLKGASQKMVKSMTEGELEELAATKRKLLPVKAGHEGRTTRSLFVSSHHCF